MIDIVQNVLSSSILLTATMPLQLLATSQMNTNYLNDNQQVRWLLTSLMIYRLLQQKVGGAGLIKSILCLQAQI